MMGEKPRRFVKIGEDMTWPAANPAVSEIAWKLRFFPDSLSRGDQLTAAAVIDAYIQMASDTQVKRNMVCRALKETL